MPLTPEQEAMRLTGIGSSDIAAVCDLYPKTWKFRRTADDVIAQKLGDKVWESKPKMRKGHRLEPFIAQWWGEDHGRPVRANKDTIRHPTINFALATIDYFTDDEPGLPLECKYVGLFPAKGWEEELSKEEKKRLRDAGEEVPLILPIYYQAQGQWQMGVSGHKRMFFAAMIEGRNDLITPFELAFDPVAFNDLVLKAGHVWQQIEMERARRAA
jgi:predicted phage-related endonuclease